MAGQVPWQRRSSSMRSGRQSQDRGGRLLDKNSRIPLLRGSSAQSIAGGSANPPGLVRSKSTLGSFTPQEQLKGGALITPQPATPMLFSGLSSKKKAGYFKDNRPLQDKEFQKDCYHLIYNYFCVNEPSVLKNGHNMRPMDIKMFLDMVSHLFLVIELYTKDTPIELHVQNYEQEISLWLKYINYPSQASKSWLKTVNAPHCLGQVYGLLSYLVSLALAARGSSPEDKLRIAAENDELKMTCFHFLIGCLTTVNKSPDEIAETCREVSSVLDDKRGVTDEAIEQLELENEQLEEQFNAPESEEEEVLFHEIEQKLAIAIARNKKAIEDTKNFNESIDSLDSQISRKERNCGNLVADTKQSLLDCEIFQGKVASQAMSVAEFNDLKQKCENLSKDINYIAQEKETNMTVLSRYEDEINVKRDKILLCASQFNQQVIHLEQKVPELHGLRTRLEPESSDVVKDVEQLVQTLSKMKEKWRSEYVEAEMMMTKLKQSKESLVNRIQSIETSTVQVQDQITTTKNDIKNSQSTTDEEVRMLESEREGMEKRIASFRERENANKNLREEHAQVAEKLAKYERFKIAQEKMTEQQWEKLEKHALYVQNKIDELRANMEGNRAMIEEEINNLMAFLKK